MGQNLLRKNQEWTSLTKRSTESEPSADQRMQFCRDDQLLPRRADAPARLLDFHQDAQGHWVASLLRGHSQLLRHQPPWQNRPWVMATRQRQASSLSDLTVRSEGKTGLRRFLRSFEANSHSIQREIAQKMTKSGFSAAGQR
jgi:hypothetical protein